MVVLEENQPRANDGKQIRLWLEEPKLKLTNRCSKCHESLDIYGIRNDGEEELMIFIDPHTCPPLKQRWNDSVIDIVSDHPNRNTQFCKDCSAHGGLLNHRCNEIRVEPLAYCYICQKPVKKWKRLADTKYLVQDSEFREFEDGRKHAHNHCLPRLTNPTFFT